MKKQKVDTKLGVAVVVIFVITAWVLVWGYDKIRNNGPSLKKSTINNQGQPLKDGNANLENGIEQAFYNKFPDWKKYDLILPIEMAMGNHAIGKFSHTSAKSGKEDGIWFATKNEEEWIISEISYVGYNGTCQNFEKYNFPSDMIPDCWDTENNIQIETKNPSIFYKNGITKKDKENIIYSFSQYIKGSESENFYKDKKLFVLINKNTENHLNGAILIGGIESISTPYFLASRVNGVWKVVFNGQDYPNCAIIEPYNFSNGVIEKCYNEATKKIEEVSF